MDENEKKEKKENKEAEQDTGVGTRRDFLLAGAAIGTGLLGAGTLAGCEKTGGLAAPVSAQQMQPPAALLKADPSLRTNVPPGQLDPYYGIWSGGQSGEMRVLGIPSCRELKRIPVFNRDSATGWGITDFSKQLLGGTQAGDTHHGHLSYKNGTYDGRYAFINCKLSGRLARVRLDTFETDRIVQLPNSQGTHGIFPQRKDCRLVLCNSEFRTPLPNDGRDLDDPKKYAALHTAVDVETMEVKWQVMIEGNLDLCATDYEDKWSFANCYNLEEATALPGFLELPKDCCYVFNLREIEKAVAAGQTITLGDSKVPVIDARGPNGKFVLRIPVPKNPHGVNVDPTGKYAVCSGKLAPVCTVIQIDRLQDAFDGKIKPEDCIVAQPEVGLGPLHTAFDNRGNAYTSIFIDSVITKWNIADAIKAYAIENAKEKSSETPPNPIRQKLDVNFQPGHVNASLSETNQADGKWLVSLNKFSKDRFLKVGPLHPDNDQLIDISGEQMVLVHDGPQYPEPHDAIILPAYMLRPTEISPRTGGKYDMINAWAKEDGVNPLQDNKVIRKGNFVRVWMTSVAPEYGIKQFTVKTGDTVQVIQTNLDNVEDLCHGFSLSMHDINMLVNPQGSESVTFQAGKPGVYWYYCPWFCHALHLEMRGRMIVEA
ncbi:nitrous-oxide reductase [Candidatus Binatia bacterium]|nr:nitrous-oxide reductase [Candidatus Binatia bacterium]